MATVVGSGDCRDGAAHRAPRSALCEPARASQRSARRHADARVGAGRPSGNRRVRGPRTVAAARRPAVVVRSGSEHALALITREGFMVTADTTTKPPGRCAPVECCPDPKCECGLKNNFFQGKRLTPD